MALEIQEYLGKEAKSSKDTSIQIKEGSIDINSVAKNSIMVDIEGLHVGMTGNLNYYMPQALKSSIPSWTIPYQKPLILHHNEKDGKIIGRVMNVEYTDVNTRSKTGALIFTCNVPDEEGKQGVKDGRLKTTSVGVTATDVRCSICGEQIELDEDDNPICGHNKGKKYDGELCYWKIYAMEAKEISYVIVPSDKYAHNIRVYSPDENPRSLKENNESKEVLDMAKPKNLDVKESKEEKKTDENIEVNETSDAEIVEEDKTSKDEVVEEEVIDTDTVGKTVEELEKIVEVLKAQLKISKAKAVKAEELKEAAEQELISANIQIKEFAAEQIVDLREKLKRPILVKESLMERTQESLLDTILDLKEEVQVTFGSVDLKESKEEIKEEEKHEEIDVQESLSSIEKPVSESFIDENKDSSVIIEKKSDIDVKENDESSNNDNEENVNKYLQFYNLLD
jgi:hypothetical protein